VDVKVIETGNGGDLSRKTKDLFVIEGLENMPYLGMFGGNVQANTAVKRLLNEQAFDFWGNNLFHPNDYSLQFNSLTERTLNNTALTSAGRLLIENAVKKDLQFMQPFAEVDVEVSILATDKIKIFITIQELGNLQSKEFIYIWDATKKELNVIYDPENPPPSGMDGFNYFLDFEID
jgi:hypothetical protein